MAQETKQLNIWWINQFALPSSQPGGGRHAQIARTLAKRGCATTIVASSTNYMTGREMEPVDTCEESSEFDFVQIPVGWRGPGGIGKLLRMRAFGKKLSSGKWIGERSRPDVIIGSSPSLHAALSASELAAKFDVPFILEVRDIWPLSLVEVAGVSQNHPVVKHLYRLEEKIVSRASQIMSLLPNAHEYFSKYGVLQEKIDWIPNGVDLDLFSMPKKDTNAKETVVMYLGSMGSPNGMLTILKAAKILQGKNANIQFRLIGDGAKKIELEQFVKDNNISSVVFEPSIPHKNVCKTIGQADILVANVPNRDLYKYGISLNKLYEYLASEKPIALACSVVDNPVTLAGADTVVPADDASALAEKIIQLSLMSEESRNTIGKMGREYVKLNNTFESIADRVISCIQKAKPK
ncbi:MAG TPA: glycosyltransferase WbuB [Phycisphaerales bacterium]|nr:glycosyltransferase WbuB [Phycisphaerales bacterium]